MTLSLGERQEIFTLNISKLIEYANSIGIKLRLKEVERTEYQQKLYMQQNKTRTSTSQHMKCLAADFYGSKDGRFIEFDDMLKVFLPLGKHWKSLHVANDWGGFFESFKDAPHFEMKG